MKSDRRRLYGHKCQTFNRRFQGGERLAAIRGMLGEVGGSVGTRQRGKRAISTCCLDFLLMHGGNVLSVGERDVSRRKVV